VDRPELPLLGGWAAAFELSAVLGLLWAVSWLLVVGNSPRASRRLCSAAEAAFIQGAMIR
jgi:hypothetical protein